MALARIMRPGMVMEYTLNRFRQTIYKEPAVAPPPAYIR